MDLGSNNHGRCITNLPDDYLYLIFEKLDSKLDQQSFGLTCHTFLNIQISSTKRLDLGCYKLWFCSSHDIINLFRFNKLLNRFSQLESLSLRRCLRFSCSCLTPLLKYGSKLYSLYLDDCRYVTDIGLTSVASGCPLLSIIDLSGCLITDSGIKILTKSCNLLKEVSLSRCYSITASGISSLNQNCRQLRALRIHGCYKIDGVSFQGFSPTLACLEARHCSFDSTGVSSILSGGGLEYLNLSYSQTYFRGHSIGLESALDLRILNLDKCTFLEEDAITKISKGCRLLQEWNLSYCSEIGLSGWKSIGLYCHNLERLHVNECDKLCDKGLLALGNGCKNLSVIYMKNCRAITPSGIRLFKLYKQDVKIKEVVLLSIVPSWAFTRRKTKHQKT